MTNAGRSETQGGTFQRDAWAFVLGLGQGGLGTARGLGEQGVRVVGVDWDRHAPGFASRWCERRLVIPHPAREPRRALEMLLAAARRLDAPAVLLPTTDVYLEFLARHERELRDSFSFTLNDSPWREALTNKRLQGDLIQANGIAYPQTYHPRDQDDVRRIGREVRFPALLKPVHGHLWYPRFHTKAIAVRSQDDLERRYAEAERHGLDLMVQSEIVGPPTNEYGCTVHVDRQGRVLGIATRRKLRIYPLDFGTSSFLVGVRCPEVERMAVDLLERIGYRGTGSVAFKRDARDGKLYVLELNGRLIGPTIHSLRCGVNLPLLAYLDLTGQSPSPAPPMCPGVRFLDLTPDILVFRELHRRGELGLLEWLRSLASARVYSHFDARDPLPFLATRRNDLRRAVALARQRGGGPRTRQDWRPTTVVERAPERGDSPGP